MGKVALVAGTTGLVGAQLLELLLADDRYSKVIALSRKPLMVSHAKLDNVVVDFDQLSEYSNRLISDVVFCCLGTTMKQAGSQAAFRKVDFEYPLEVARIAKGLEAKQYHLVTALGASKKSSFYYNKVKGEVEEAILELGFESYHIFRPSFLSGERTESRIGENATKIFFKYFGFLVPKKFKAIASSKVARAMVAKSKEEARGVFIHESDALQNF
ncbi:MAG: oxidoreductase [Bacteroidia bacterium]|nr:oxidoreductase [Bacteroidia bacterium]